METVSIKTKALLTNSKRDLKFEKKTSRFEVSSYWERFFKILGEIPIFSLDLDVKLIKEM